VSDVLQDIGQGLSALGSNWTKYSVVGSFLLYLTGYLAVRFHVTAIGIGTDLAVLDERYLFAGARFVVNVVASVPSLLLLLLPVAAVVWIVAKAAPSLAASLRRSWLAQPALVVWAAVVVAILIVQLVMRQCFLLSNLLLSPNPPQDPAWLVKFLLDDTNTYLPLYFAALVAACALSVVVLFAVRDVDPRYDTVSMTAGKALLAFLAAVQILLLPVNYGILIMDTTFPRVAAVGAQRVAAPDSAWLVWEGKDGVTFLIRRTDTTRVLQTVPRDEAKRIEIVGFDPIFPTLFARH
jgi:hypothetical protein